MHTHTHKQVYFLTSIDSVKITSSHLHLLFIWPLLFWIGNKCFEGQTFPAYAQTVPGTPETGFWMLRWFSSPGKAEVLIQEHLFEEPAVVVGPSADEVSGLKWLQRSEQNEWVISFAN